VRRTTAGRSTRAVRAHVALPTAISHQSEETADWIARALLLAAYTLTILLPQPNASGRYMTATLQRKAFPGTERSTER